jgi:hypothetical protein
MKHSLISHKPNRELRGETFNLIRQSTVAFPDVFAVSQGAVELRLKLRALDIDYVIDWRDQCNGTEVLVMHGLLSIALRLCVLRH